MLKSIFEMVHYQRAIHTLLYYIKSRKKDLVQLPVTLGQYEGTH